MSSDDKEVRNDEGASLVEYALLIALVALACITALVFLGGTLFGSYDGAGSSIQSAFN